MSEKLRSKTPVVATVFDSARPMRWLLGVGMCACVVGVVSLPALLFGLATIFAWDLRPRRPPRSATIRATAGGIHIESVGKVRARDIVGATTARHEGHFTLMLSRKRKREPLFLEVPDEASLRYVTRSLGIGHHGMGEVGVALEPATGEHTGWAVSLLMVPLLVVTTLAYLTHASAFDALAFGTTCVGLLAAALATVRAAMPATRLTLAGGGLMLPRRYSSLAPAAFGTHLPFNTIESVSSSARALHLCTLTGQERQTIAYPASVSRWMRWGASRAELGQLVSQILAASERARGNYVLKHEAGAATERLQRKAGEPLRAWIARIDALGAGAGYRTAGIEEEDLWTIFEDPDAEPDLRTAAARLLTRTLPEPERLRVAEVLATVRNDELRARIYASVHDDMLEDEERRELRKQR